MQLLVAAGQAKPLQLSTSHLLYPQTEAAQVGDWRGRWQSITFFMQQLIVAIQICCENGSDEVSYVHVGVEAVE